jgi:hypothetical protein
MGTDTMHPTTFEYLKPNDGQMYEMGLLRKEFSHFAGHILASLPAGPDRDHVIRLIRDAAMWSNIAITRNPDGSPR